jgi:hypothetical protein
MGGRVVDRARLESVFTLTGNEGSNPSPSAKLKQILKGIIRGIKSKGTINLSLNPFVFEATEFMFLQISSLRL